MSIKNDLRADFILLLTAAIWGLAFVFQRTGMDHIGPITFVFGRFFIAAIAILPIWYLMEKPQKVLEITAVDKKAMLLGVLIAVGAVLQQVGLLYTSVSRAGFLTGIYIVFVPLIGLLLGNRTEWPTWLGIALSILGLYFLAQIESDEFLLGDALILISTVVWALHVVYTGRRANEISVYRLMFIQFSVAAVISWVIMVFVETWSWQAVLDAGWALLYVGVFSSGVAFSLQVVGMRTAPASHAAIILSFEAVFAAIGGWWLLDEYLTVAELIGCGLILFGGLVSQLKVFLKQSEMIQHPSGVN